MVVAERRYTWRPDLPDHRDIIFNDAEEILASHQVPLRWDLAPKMPVIYDQSQLGSCTGNGWARVMEYRAIVQGEPAITPSRLFIYFNERLAEGTVNQDAGAQVRTGARIVSTMGVPPETEWPYDIRKFAVRPPPQVYTDARKHEALKYQRVLVGGSGAPMRTAISRGLPIVFGFSVPDYFETNQGWSFDQVLPLPDITTSIIGGHCVVITGYDYSCTRFPVPAFQCDNSWGPDWGLAGRFWMDSRWFNQGPNALASDFWTVSSVT